MSKQQIKKEIRELQRAIREGPRVIRFRGKRVVPADDWEFRNWNTLPDSYNLLVFLNVSPDWPKDWMRDYRDLLWKLEDKGYGEAICGNCAINLAHEAQQDISEHEEREKAGYEGLKDPSPEEKAQTAREKAMRVLRHALYDDGGKARGRTCQVVNYFKCPYHEERGELIKDGRIFQEVWYHLEWYERHWYNNHTSILAEDERKWYHWNEPKPIDLTNPDDVVKSLEEGRYDKVVEEHERYMKETNRKIWSL